jgi:hypothetical protein
MSDKIHPRHLARKAILYVRQSSSYQVVSLRRAGFTLQIQFQSGAPKGHQVPFTLQTLCLFSPLPINSMCCAISLCLRPAITPAARFWLLLARSNL